MALLPYGIISSPGRGKEFGTSILRGLKMQDECEASLQLTFTHNPLPMWIYDLESPRFLEVNEAAVARYGYADEEFLTFYFTLGNSDSTEGGGP